MGVCKAGSEQRKRDETDVRSSERTCPGSGAVGELLRNSEAETASENEKSFYGV